jgi:glycosyltransferase involved in cell wall biosynthesis
MPSLDEGFGLPLLEAMAAGLPVIAASRGALPEVAGGAATLVNDDSPEAWAEAIRSVIDNESLRQALQRAGRIRAAQFSWERTATETAALYREVLRY